MMRLLMLAPLALVGACVSLLPEPPPAPRLFVLEAGPAPRAEGAPVSAAIAVASPNGERAILGAEIAWRTGAELVFIDGTQWSSRAEDALQTLLIETLTRQARFAAAARAGEVRASYDLRWDVLDFEIDSVAMEARFTANVHLSALPGRQVVGQEIIAVARPLRSASASASAEALIAAAREGALAIGLFAADAAARHEAERAAAEAARAAAGEAPRRPRR